MDLTPENRELIQTLVDEEHVRLKTGQTISDSLARYIALRTVGRCLEGINKSPVSVDLLKAYLDMGSPPPAPPAAPEESAPVDTLRLDIDGKEIVAKVIPPAEKVVSPAKKHGRRGKWEPLKRWICQQAVPDGAGIMLTFEDAKEAKSARSACHSCAAPNKPGATYRLDRSKCRVRTQIAPSLSSPGQKEDPPGPYTLYVWVKTKG